MLYVDVAKRIVPVKVGRIFGRHVAVVALDLVVDVVGTVAGSGGGSRAASAGSAAGAGSERTTRRVLVAFAAVAGQQVLSRVALVNSKYDESTRLNVSNKYLTVCALEWDCLHLKFSGIKH